jgi:hypothetical protein
MTISAYSRNSYQTGASVTGFPFTFQVADSSELEVLLRDTTTGETTTLAETTNYTVTFTGSLPYYSGGSITTTVTYPTGSTLIIQRQTEQVQETDLNTGGALPAETIEKSLDDLQTQIQENTAKSGKHLSFPSSDPDSLSAILPNSIDRADAYLKFDSAGGPTLASGEIDLDTVTVSPFGANLVGAADAPAGQLVLGMKDEDNMASNSNVAPASQQSVKAYVDNRAPVYSVKEYGAIGNGTANDTDAINDAITACALAGGGIVLLPEGTYSVTTVDLTAKSNVNVIGVGKEATVIKAAAGGSILVCFDNSNFCSLRDLSCDCSLQTGAWCIDIGKVTDLLIENVKINDSNSNSIYFTDDTCTRCLISNVTIVDTGGSGVFIKNTGSDSSGIVFENIHITNPEEYGLYLRSPCVLNNINIDGLVGVEGILFQQTDASGLGAHGSSLSNFYISGSSTSKGIGINANYVKVNNGSISGVSTGMDISAGTRNSVENVSFTNCTAVGLRTGSSDNIVTNTVFDTCVTGLTVFGDNGVIGSCNFNGNTTDLLLNVGATNNRVSNNIFTATVTNSGTGNKIHDNNGYVTESSGTATIVASGTVTSPANTPHGLSATPTSVMVTASTGRAADEFLIVSSVDATNIVFTCNNSASNDIDFYWEAKVL